MSSSLWRNRDYVLLWSGQALSDIGGAVSELAYPLFVLSLTHAPAAAGFVAALRALPAPFFGLFAGVLVDRWNRKRVMLWCDIIRALSLASIPLAFFLGYLTIWQLYLTALIEGTLLILFDLAKTAAILQVVTEKQLTTAMAQDELVEGTTALFGAPLSGFLYTLGRVIPFIADALSYAASIITLLLIRTPFVIILAQQQHASAFVIGLIFALGGLGAILGSLAASFIGQRLTVGQSVLFVRWFFALVWPLYAFAPYLFVLGALDFGIGLVDPIEDVAYFSCRLKLIPDELRGRVISACRLFPGMMRPIGLALTGILIQRIGVFATILCFWAGLLLMAIFVLANVHIRKARFT